MMAATLDPVDESQKMSLTLPVGLRRRVKAVQASRQCSEQQAIRWLLTKACEWHESLSAAQRMAL